MTTSEILRAAAARLKTRGWKQNGYGGVKGPNCAVGAIRQEGFGYRGDLAVQAFERVVGEDAEPWNDVEGRTADEVIGALLEAAEYSYVDGE